MIIIQGILVQEDILKEQFLCNLNACKGACCWEGDYGAPLEKEELATLDQIYEEVKPFLPATAQEKLDNEGRYTYYREPAEFGTPLLDKGPCVYMNYNELGIAYCGIEKAFREGKVNFQKPVSCHLYPIRVQKEMHTGFLTLVYDRWDICSAACRLGAQQKMPLYQFVKDGLIRRFGPEFYEELEAAANHLIE